MLKKSLPDVISTTTLSESLPLQWVGMEQIDVPLNVVAEVGKTLTVTAKADIYVSLDKTEVKGIHMSRLYTLLNDLADVECTKATLDRLLDEAVSSQAGISHSARIDLSFDLLLKKKALISDKSGHQAYPISICGELMGDKRVYEMTVTIPYSSTCPCSASLARQLTADAVDQHFPTGSIDKASLLEWMQSEQGSIATPHSQRSYAYIKITTGENPWPELSALVFKLEEVIGTPVQTAVKRSDEQEFARLNAENLMFCEDAARRIKAYLENLSYADDYWFKVEHQESLHAHNAVVIDRKY